MGEQMKRKACHPERSEGSAFAFDNAGNEFSATGPLGAPESEMPG
jgi:hypothetical protein